MYSSYSRSYLTRLDKCPLCIRVYRTVHAHLASIETNDITRSVIVGRMLTADGRSITLLSLLLASSFLGGAAFLSILPAKSVSGQGALLSLHQVRAVQYKCLTRPEHRPINDNILILILLIPHNHACDA
jgi:hypothetical protein